MKRRQTKKTKKPERIMLSTELAHVQGGSILASYSQPIYWNYTDRDK